MEVKRGRVIKLKYSRHMSTSQLNQLKYLVGFMSSSLLKLLMNITMRMIMCCRNKFP